MPLITPEPPVTRELARMRNRMRRFFDEPLAFSLTMPAPLTRRADREWWTPTVEASETPTEFLVTAELPGISPENVEVQVSEGMLSVRGMKKDERSVDDKARRYHMWEREYGSFERSFRFPSDIDTTKIEASFSNGVLTVKVPKLEQSAPEVRTIPIAKK